MRRGQNPGVCGSGREYLIDLRIIGGSKSQTLQKPIPYIKLLQKPGLLPHKAQKQSPQNCFIVFKVSQASSNQK
jgi:hypothetical protein